MKLHLPLLPDELYLQYLENLENVSLYSSLYSYVPDARYRHCVLDREGMKNLLERVRGRKVYLLVNARFHHPSMYRGEGVRELAGLLEEMEGEGLVTGIVFADAYMLTALCQEAPDLASRMEAVPSVNLMIDSPAKLQQVANLLNATPWKAPGYIVPDRSLNRDRGMLERVAEGARELWPGVEVVLLANEGCLPHCPWKPAHDGLVAASFLEGFPERTLELNRELGCLEDISREPWKILTSPFIRPGETVHYGDIADGFKLSGRTLEPGQVIEIVKAYRHGKYSGNLVELLDAPRWLAPRLLLDNEKLPQDFGDITSRCRLVCGSCFLCRDMYREAGKHYPEGEDLIHLA
jgi:hypothetical protein